MCCWKPSPRSMRVDTKAVGLDDLGRPEGFLARARRRLAQARAGGDRRTAPKACTPTSAPGWNATSSPRAARTAAQRLQAQQHHPEPGRPVAARGGGLGPGHARRPAVRFRHAADLLGARGRPPADARHGADAGGRGRACARARRQWPSTPDYRPRHVRLPVSPGAGDVQAVRHLPAAWPALPQRRHAGAALRAADRHRHRHPGIHPRDRPRTRF